MLFNEDVTPCDNEVKGIDLVSELESLFRKVVYLENEEYQVIIYWILASYFVKPASEKQPFSLFPYINITSPDKACGKTSCKKIISELVNKPLLAENATMSAIFRTIQYHSPVILFDEMDSWVNEKNVDIMSIFNSGYDITGKVIRTNAAKHENIDLFSTWCPKVLVGINNGYLTDTTQSRCLVIQMKRKPKNVTLSRIRDIALNNENYFSLLRQKILRFKEDNLNKVFNCNIQLTNEVSDRDYDNWEPLLKVAKVISENEYTGLLDSLKFVKSNTIEEISIEIELLKDIKEYLNQVNQSDEIIKSQLICDFLKNKEDSPWSEIKNKGITPHYLAKMLYKYSLKPEQHRVGQENIRGYLKKDLLKVFDMYL